MATAHWQIGELKLQYDLVWSMAISSLKVRLPRTLLTVLTITTSTAFLMYLLTMPKTDDPVESQSWGLMLALSLLVSIAGVLNTMLMSVTQRYREIGTIKCLGALDSFVLYSVLFESAIVGLVGAVIGVVLGILISVLLGLADYGFAVFQNLRLGFLPGKILIVFLVGVFLTTIGAAIPAWIASKMPPMDAMRGEK
jgi:ABC-type antimicrobial peptide transport system permease subunit